MNKKKDVLLPNYFKVIGVAVIILTLISVAIINLMNTEIIPTHNGLWKVMTLNVLILGLFFIAMARDKFEDEMTLDLRVKAMAWTFSWAVLYVIIKSFVVFLFKNPPQDLSSQQVVFSMLCCYIPLYYLKKRCR